MTLNKIKPVIEEIDGVRCVVVESGIDAARAEFLTKLLAHNHYEVKSYQAEDKSITLGVTNLLFNPVIDVYKRKLKSLTNHKVTPAYWLQKSEDEAERQVNYWKETDMNF
jgi:hypothetical protein